MSSQTILNYLIIIFYLGIFLISLNLTCSHSSKNNEHKPYTKYNSQYGRCKAQKRGYFVFRDYFTQWGYVQIPTTFINKLLEVTDNTHSIVDAT